MPFRFKTIFTVAALTLLLVTGACDNSKTSNSPDQGPGSETPQPVSSLSVTSTIPGKDVTDVGLTTNIVVKFDSDVDPSTIGADAIVIDPFVKVKEIHSFMGRSNEVIISIESNLPQLDPLAYNTKYTVTLKAGAIKDSSGRTLNGDYVWSFTTGSNNSWQPAGYDPLEGVHEQWAKMLGPNDKVAERLISIENAWKKNMGTLQPSDVKTVADLNHFFQFAKEASTSYFLLPIALPTDGIGFNLMGLLPAVEATQEDMKSMLASKDLTNFVNLVQKSKNLETMVESTSGIQDILEQAAKVYGIPLKKAPQDDVTINTMATTFSNEALKPFDQIQGTAKGGGVSYTVNKEAVIEILQNLLSKDSLLFTDGTGVIQHISFVQFSDVKYGAISTGDVKFLP